DLPDLLHALLAFGLLGEQLALASNIAAIAFRRHVFAHRRDCFAGNDAAADGGLNGDFEHMAADFAAEFVDELAAAALGLRAVDNNREGIDEVAVHQDIDADEIIGAVADQFIIHRAIAARDALQLVVQVVDHFRERQFRDEHDALRAEIFHAHEDAAAVGDHRHQVADVLGRDNEADL